MLGSYVGQGLALAAILRPRAAGEVFEFSIPFEAIVEAYRNAFLTSDNLAYQVSVISDGFAMILSGECFQLLDGNLGPCLPLACGGKSQKYPYLYPYRGGGCRWRLLDWSRQDISLKAPYLLGWWLSIACR